MQEPHKLDPALYRSSASSYFFSNIHRGLYRYDNERGLIPEGAKSCNWINPKKLLCRLNSNIRWSDGKSVTAEEYIRGFHHLINPETIAPRANLLFRLKNAKEIYTKKLAPGQLGVSSPQSDQLIFEFAEKDREFIHKLSSNAIIPRRNLKTIQTKDLKTLPVNGPYRVKNWVPGQKLTLEANPYYPFGNKNRPNVDVYFIEDDKTALRFYKSGKLKFLRRLPSGLIDTYKKSPEFLQLPVARFDYIGFGPRLMNRPQLRKAMSLALNYQELKDLYSALGRPGCPSIPARYMDKVPCHKFQLKAAKEAFAQYKKGTSLKGLKFGFSKMGGEDVRRGMEWIQDQWLKNLGLKTILDPTEQGVYLYQLANSPPDLFRKGVGLDRPTCLAALETFSKKGSENFIRLNNEDYEEIISKLDLERSSKKQKKLCRQAVEILIDNHLLIPMGEIHFSLLVDPRFTGWKLNEMNQLDLTDLRFDPTKKEKP